MNDKSEQIKFRILGPIILVGAILVSLSLLGGYFLQKQTIDSSVRQRIAGAHRLYGEVLFKESRLMSGQIDFLKRDQTLSALFVDRDRERLFSTSRPYFEKMRSEYHITHFYFHGADKICFLRVHSPGRHGDLINRFTMKGAAASGEPFYGIELGPLGTFTLRVVHPWVVDNRLAGYIELGMEIEHVTKLIKQTFALDLLVLIKKDFLKREDWEAGLKILNREGHWNQYPDFVIVDQTVTAGTILKETIDAHQKDHDHIFTTDIDGRQYKGSFKNLMDAGDRQVGEIVSLAEVSDQRTDMIRWVAFFTGVSLVIGSCLIIIFSRYIGGIQDRLIASRTKLRSEIETRRQSEAALADSEKRFRSLFEESKDAIVNTDTNGKFLMINPAGRKLFGLTDTDLKSTKFQDLYSDPEMGRKFSAAIAEQGYIREFGVQLYGEGGQVMDCLMTVTAKLSEHGTVTGFEGIIRNVTPFKAMERELRRLATIDSLTSMNNRRNFLDLAQKEMNRCMRHKHPLSLIMLDIDFFKKVNDSYGHAAGDQVLIDFSSTCLKELRESDIMGRLGGEEFAIVAVESKADGAVILAERIRKAVASHRVIYENKELSVTVSMGVASLLPSDDMNALIERADAALYQAKDNGRNQVIHA